MRITLLPGIAPARTVTVRPLRFAIPARIAQGGRTVEFTLDRPRKVPVEINDRLDPLFILADAPDVPDTKARYYFAPGVHRIPGNGTLRPESNDRVYIAAGAIVEGRFLLAPGSTNIAIRARGVLSGGPCPRCGSKPAISTMSTTARSGPTDRRTSCSKASPSSRAPTGRSRSTTRVQTDRPRTTTAT